MLQLKSSYEQISNLDKGLNACAKAKEMGTDLAVFPEMWNIGYKLPESDESYDTWKQRSISEESEYFQRFVECARQNEIAIALTYLNKNKDKKPYNSVSLIDKMGEIRLTYSKVHTCDFSDEKYITPGQSFQVCELDVGSHVIKVGAMICYDREFPESARVLMLKGAEIIIIPNACEIDINRKSQLRARAYENMTGCVLVNYPGKVCKGGSIAFDGLSFTEAKDGEDGLSRDMTISEADEKESIIIAEFDIEKLRRYREKETWGNSYRKPRSYSEIVSNEVKGPFKRNDSRR